MPNVDAKIVDDSWNEIGPYDVRGKLCVRVATDFRGHLDNPRANSESFDEDGYFHSGVIAILSSSNDSFYLVERKKELIKVRVFQAAPAELGGILLSHPCVKNVDVFGAEGRGGELPRAHVITREGQEMSEKDVKGRVKERLADYKQLEGGVRSVEIIPKTASGKILQLLLRHEARMGRRMSPLQKARLAEALISELKESDVQHVENLSIQVSSKPEVSPLTITLVEDRGVWEIEHRSQFTIHSGKYNGELDRHQHSLGATNGDAQEDVVTQHSKSR
ncbi:hypothetical protein DOTSEDRAFT_33144 [Dothistroma septosporum NZE10]|uniref:AMP-binding enzyme C-terminal domain-containing protein n=1 Tax=Dothistroma septosporum (strain NZE10 / CBS 128990) TaxID=675120 RepID=N1PW16_DOTSN|nr:hypothetical protein DOTSEDRAFT_33144 [Dothistroma septosporum NZE10]